MTERGNTVFFGGGAETETLVAQRSSIVLKRTVHTRRRAAMLHPLSHFKELLHADAEMPVWLASAESRLVTCYPGVDLLLEIACPRRRQSDRTYAKT